MDYDTFKYKCGKIKYKIESFIYDVKIFVHDIFYPWNKLKIKTLDRGWHERYETLLHANFQILTDYIEQELFSANSHHEILLDIEKETKWMYDYKYDDETIKRCINDINKSNSDMLKLMKLYKWWKVDRPIRQKNFPSDLDEFGKYDDMCEKEDEDCIIELVKLRRYLCS